MVENANEKERGVLASGTEAEIEKPKERILLVDDNETDLLFMRMIIGKLQQDRVFETETASGVGEAKAKIEGGYEPRLIISDLTMPNETGYDFYQWLVKNWPDWAARFILHTSGSMDPKLGQFVDEMEERGRLIRKTSDVEELRQAVKEVLDRQWGKG